MKRRACLVLLLGACVLQACTTTHVFDTAGPNPGQNVVGVVLSTDKRIRFRESAAVDVTDRAVTVHTANTTTVYPSDVIRRVVVEEFHLGIAAMQVVLFVTGNLVLSALCDDMVDIDRTEDGGWSSECADEDEDWDDADDWED